MRKNYNFKINPNPLSSEDISAHKDFGALMENFENAPLAKSKSTFPVRRLMYWSTAVAATVAMLFIFKNVYTTQKVFVSEKTFFAQKACIDAPVKAALPAFNRFAVNVNQGGVFDYKSGSRLIVPSAAFMNDRGSLVEGEVEIFYREYSDYLDFFLSGMPMKYDSAGNQYILQSSGIAEIYAEKDGKRVALSAGKTIKVEMVGQVMLTTNRKVPDYNVYRLDTTNRVWVYQDVNLMQIMEEQLEYGDPLYAQKKVLQDALIEISAKENTALLAVENNIPTPLKPLQPQAKNNNQISFELDFLKDKLPEGDDLLYSGTIWQLSPNNPEIDQRAFQVAWEDASVTKINGIDYELQLISGETTLKLIANPVLTGSDYENAIQQYEEELKAYALAIREREKALQQDKVALHKRFDAQKKVLKTQYLDELTAAGLKGEVENKNTSRKVINTFQANSLGVWICAQPVTPKMIKLKARFIDKKGNELEPAVAFIADKSRNTSIKFLAQPGATVTFDDKAENIMWILLENDKIAVYRPEQFKNIQKTKGKYTFEMEIIDRAMLREFDFREVLQF